MKDKAKNPQKPGWPDDSKTKQNGSLGNSTAKGPSKEYETGRSPEKPEDKKPKQMGESETDIDDETTI